MFCVGYEEMGWFVLKIYVKVYVRMKDGIVKFYKDGYIDLCGWFDYGLLSMNEFDFVDCFLILIYSDEFGVVVWEVKFL